MEKTTLQGALISVLQAKCYSGDEIKNEKGGAYGTDGGQQRCIQSFGWEI